MPLVRTTYGITKYLPVTKPSGVTADPLFAFHFKPDGDYLEDRTGNARDASIVTGAFEFQQDPETGLFGIYFGSGDHELILPAEETLRVAKDDAGGGDASLTLEAIVNVTPNGGNILTCDSSGESPQTNYLWQLGGTWDDAGVRKWYAFTERGGGTNNEVFANAKATFDSLIYLALTISADGLTWKYYVNGILVGTHVLANPAEKNDTGGNTQRVRIGRDNGDGGDFKGLLCSLRMTAEVFDQADITETWNDIQGQIGTFFSDTDETLVEDTIAFPEQGGPRHYKSGLPGPQLMPGPITQQTGSVGPFDDTQIDDEAGPGEQMGDAHGVEAGMGVRQPRPTGPEHSADVFDEISYFLSVLTDYRTTTNDFNGHPHFIGHRVVKATVYDAAGEAGLWTTPTDPSFTGYGKDGHYYIAGVDQGTFAPWYDEVESDDRGPDQAFPDKVLICLTQDGSSLTNKEVVIFSLDNFPTTLDMWMRFKFNSGNSTFYLLGNEDRQIQALAMANGVLVVGSKAVSSNGRLHFVDFKGVGQDCAYLVAADDDWLASAGKTIVDRNTTTWWTTSGAPGYRTDSESLFDVAMRLDADKQLWVAVAGEDPGPNLYRMNALNPKPNFRITPTGEVGDVNIGDVRRTAFDEDNHWWLAIEKKLFRIPTVDYQEGYAYLDTSVPARRRAGAPEWVELPYNITHIVPLGNYIFIGTEAGIYQLHRGTLDFYLAYTAVGDGGGGNNNTPPNGELFAGGFSEVVGLWGEALHSSHYLYVATRRGATVIRLMDDKAVASLEFNVLHEPGAHFTVPTID